MSTELDTPTADAADTSPAHAAATAGPTEPVEPLGPIDADLRALLREVLHSLFERKAEDVTVIDVRGRTSYCDLFVLATGSQARQVSAMADGIVQFMKKDHGRRPGGVEGKDTGRWVLVDLGDLVVHAFEGPMRGYYDLDGLWADAPRIGLDTLGFGPEGEDLEAPTEVEQDEDAAADAETEV
jgi:ribosome-associated protein